MADDQQPQQSPSAESRFSANARPAIRIGLIVSILGVAVAAGNSVVDLLRDVFGELHHLGECCADYRSYKDEDSSARKQWVPVIQALRDRTADLERIGDADVRELQKDVARIGAKFELFTTEAGTTRAEFRRRLDRLEARADRVDAKQ
jgi:Rad3-related DNA helicase